MRRAALLVHPRNPAARDIRRIAERELRDAGVELECIAEDGSQDGPALPDGADVLIAIGGDGTVLRAQRMAVPRGVPVLGVACGRLGFLAEVAPDDVEQRLAQLLNGAFRIERRALLSATLLRPGAEEERYYALNDAVLARGQVPRSLSLEVAVDGADTAHYVADGLIAATATGSTAYSLAAGGPILAPELRNLVLTPIAAHLSFVRSTILREDSVVEVRLAREQEAFLAVDGQVDVQVQIEHRVRIQIADVSALFVRFGPPSDFYRQLVPRLQHNLARLSTRRPGTVESAG